MNEQINGTAAEIEAAREILDAGGIPADTYWYQAITGEDFGSGSQKLKASDWVTCACGERSSRFERYTNHYGVVMSQPVDNMLTGYGLYFHAHVVDKERCQAAQTLVAIEKRVQELEGVG